MPMNTENDVGQFVSELLQQEGPKLGAHLGGRIRGRFPEFNVRTHGSLKRFLLQFCPSVVFLGKQGMDDLWGTRENEFRESQANGSPVASISQSIPPVASPHQQPIRRMVPRPLSPWRAFTNPSAVELLFVNPNNGDVAAFYVPAQAPNGWKEVPKLATEEIRTFSREFAVQFGSSDQEHLLGLLTEHEFWHRWGIELKIWKAGAYYGNWIGFRNSRIESVFKQRLEGLGVADDVKARAWTGLRGANYRSVPSHSLPASCNKSSPDGLIAKPTHKVGRDRDLDLRSAVLISINALTDEDLRKIWLPAGLLIDAIKKQR